MRGKELCRRMMLNDFSNVTKATRSELATVSNPKFYGKNQKPNKNRSKDNQKENQDSNSLSIVDKHTMEDEMMQNMFGNMSALIDVNELDDDESNNHQDSDDLL